MSARVEVWDALCAPASVRMTPIPDRGLIYVQGADDGTGAHVRPLDLLRAVREAVAAASASEETPNG